MDERQNINISTDRMKKTILIIFAAGAMLCGCRQGAGSTSEAQNADSCDIIADTAVEAVTVAPDTIAAEPVKNEKDFEWAICDDRPRVYEIIVDYNKNLEKRIKELKEYIIQRGITHDMPEIPENVCKELNGDAYEECLMARQESLKAVLAELESIIASTKKKPKGAPVPTPESTVVDKKGDEL